MHRDRYVLLLSCRYSDTILPDDVDHLHYVGELAAVAIDEASTINSHYQGRVNSSGVFLYAAAGGSDDWVKAVAGVDLSYCVELPNGGKLVYKTFNFFLCHCWNNFNFYFCFTEIKKKIN